MDIGLVLEGFWDGIGFRLGTWELEVGVGVSIGMVLE